METNIPGFGIRKSALGIKDLAKICIRVTTRSRNTKRGYGRSEDSLGLHLCDFVAATQCNPFRAKVNPFLSKGFPIDE